MHHSSFIRIAALSIVTNPASNPTSSSSPYSIDTFQLLQQILPHFQTETNPKVRNEYLVIIKSLFVHVRRGLALQLTGKTSQATHANGNIAVNIDNGKDIKIHARKSKFVENNAAFLTWFDEFLINELHPSASYQRHITALKAMLSIDFISRFKNGAINVFNHNRIGSKSHNTAHDCFNGVQLVRLFLDLTMDPFDDVRSAAASLLRNLLSNLDSTSIFFNHNIPMNLVGNEDKVASSISTQVRYIFNNIFASTIDRAKMMMSCTGRADHADGFGRLCQLKFDSYEVTNTQAGTENRISVMENLLFSLSADIRNLRNNFSFTIASSPLHGHLIALRYFALN